MFDRERARPLADLVGQQQLATRWRPDAVLVDLEAALVGDLEPAHLFDGVTPELHPQWVFLGGREDVEDAAADGELAAPLDHVDARVGDARKAPYDVIEVDVIAGTQADRLEVAEVWDLRLEHRAHGSDDDGDAVRRRVSRVRVAQATEDGKPPPDGVRTGAQPLVRQRLPGGVVDDTVGGKQRLHGGDQVLGLTTRRRDREDGAAGARGEGREEERP